MRSSRTVAAVAALTGMLFLQAALAFSRCELPGRAAAMAAAVAMAGMHGCEDADRASLGLAHCAGEQPTVLNAQAEPWQPALPLAQPALPGLSEGVASVAWRPAPPPAAGPPPRILFQTFLL